MRKAKIRVKIKDDIMKVKFMINHNMLTEREANKRNLEQDYITHIIMKVEERILFEFKPSENIVSNPLFKFKVKKKELKLGDVINLEWTTFLGEEKNYTKTINEHAYS